MTFWHWRTSSELDCWTNKESCHAWHVRLLDVHTRKTIMHGWTNKERYHALDCWTNKENYHALLAIVWQLDKQGKLSCVRLLDKQRKLSCLQYSLTAGQTKKTIMLAIVWLLDKQRKLSCVRLLDKQRKLSCMTLVWLLDKWKHHGCWCLGGGTMYGKKLWASLLALLWDYSGPTAFQPGVLQSAILDPKGVLYEEECQGQKVIN